MTLHLEKVRKVDRSGEGSSRNTPANANLDMNTRPPTTTPSTEKHPKRILPETAT
jgi:hypothetical protein